MDVLKEWFSLAAILISLGATAYSWMTARSKVNAEHLKRVDGNLKDHDRRIQKVESEIEHLPSKDSHHNLEIALAEMNGELKAMATNVDSLARTTRRMEEFLMKSDT